jgi:hypothetical protein
MGVGAVIYISSFIKNGSVIQNLIRGIHIQRDIQTACRSHKPTLIFFPK